MFRNTAKVLQVDLDLAWYVARTTVFETDYPHLEEIWIRNSGSGLSGHIKYPQKEIVISLPPRNYFPSVEWLGYTDAPIYAIENELEAITAVLGHELYHLKMYLKNESDIRSLNKRISQKKVIDELFNKKHSEADCEKAAVNCLAKLRAVENNTASITKLEKLKYADQHKIKYGIDVLNYQEIGWFTLQELQEMQHGAMC